MQYLMRKSVNLLLGRCTLQTTESPTVPSINNLELVLNIDENILHRFHQA